MLELPQVGLMLGISERMRSAAVTSGSALHLESETTKNKHALLSERVRHDSVWTVAFQISSSSSLSHLQVCSRFRTRSDLTSFRNFNWILVLPFQGSSTILTRDHRSRINGEKEQGAQALSLGFTAIWSLLNGWLLQTRLCEKVDSCWLKDSFLLPSAQLCCYLWLLYNDLFPIV